MATRRKITPVYHLIAFIFCCLWFIMLTPCSILAAAGDNSIDNNDSTTVRIDAYYLHHHLLKHLPLRGAPQEYYGLFPGVVRQDFRGVENLHVRGSRPDEIVYSFEGADIRSAYTGRNLFRIIPEALDQIELQTSPSASSSQASVLFQHRLRRGDENFSLKLRGESDRFTHSYKQRLGTFSYGYYNLLLLTEGKLFKDNVRFFIAGEGESLADHYRKFWDGFCIGGPEFPLVDQYDGRSLYQVAGTDKIIIQPGNIPNANADQFVLNSIIEADYNPFVLRTISLYNWEKQQQNDTPIYHLFNQRRIPVLEQYAGLLSLQMDYAGAKNLNAHFQFDWLGSGNKNYDPLFGDNFWLYRDSLAIVAKGLPWNAEPRLTQFYDSYILGPEDLNFYSFHFSAPGDIITTYSKSVENYWAISGSAQKKWGQHNLNFGVSFQRRTLRRFTIGNSLVYINEYRKLKQVAESQYTNQLLFIRNWGNVEAFGYDIFGNKIEKADAVNDGPRHPHTISLYLDDGFTTQNLQLSLGLRYDSFTSDEPIFRDPVNPDFDFYPGNILPEAMKKSPDHHYLLPRLAALFTVTEDLKFHLNWGKYAQQVRFSDVSSSRAYHAKYLFGGYFYTDLHGFNARPVRSTQTQAGISYLVASHFRADATVFYKIMEGHLESDQVFLWPIYSVGGHYIILANTGEAIAKGLELSLHYQHHGFFSWLNYALSDVRGFNSYPISNLRDVERGIYSSDHIPNQARQMSPLDYNQRHRLNALLSYEFDKTHSHWLAGTGVHALFRFNSGHNFTLFYGSLG